MKKLSALSRIIAFALVLCLCAAFVPTMTFAADTAGTIWLRAPKSGSAASLTDTVGDNTPSVLQWGDGSVSYDADADVVTLTNLNFEGNNTGSNSGIEITGAGKVTVMLVGENVVSGGQFWTYDTDLIFDGTGSLSVTTPGSSAYYLACNVTVNGGTLIANAPTENNTNYGKTAFNVTKALVVNGGSIDSTGGNVQPVRVGTSLTMTGGTIRAQGTKEVIYVNSSLNVTGGSIKSTATSGYGAIIAAKDIFIENATIEVSAVSSALQSTNGTLTIRKGSVTANTTQDLPVVAHKGAVLIEDSTVTATAGTAASIKSGGDMTISNSSVTATAANGAFLFFGTLTFSGGTVVANVTGEGKHMFYQANGVGTNVVVTPDANLTLTSASPVDYSNYTVSDEGVYYAAGKSFVDNGTAVQTVRLANVDLSATVNGNKADVQLILDGEVIETVADANGVVNFKTLTLEEGTYTFTVKQIAENGAGWTYDANEYTITVTVADGTAIVEGEAIFTNTYDYVVNTDVTVNVKVSVSDRTLKEGDITANLLKDGEIVATGTIDAEGKISFTIDASKDMAGVYTVSLSTEIKGITLPEAQTLTVEVKDNGDGTATVTATNTDLTFNGSYRVPFAAGKIENGKYIVDETGKATEMGLIKIGEDYYYAGPNGVLVTGKYYAWLLNENCDIETGWYCFGADGKMLQGICEHPDKDGLYYFENGKPTEKGLFLYDGNYYVAQYDGMIITGKYYVWKIDDSAKDAYVEGWYEFDENGVIVPLKNGIVDGKYYVDGKPTEMGLFEYEGDLYVAQYDGKIITGKYYVWKVQEGLEDLNGAWRYFGNDGKLLQGIVDGYYYVNGVRTEMGLFKYTDNNYYVAQYDGKIITSENYTKHGAGKYYVWKIHESANDKKAGWYFFDAKGRMIQWFNDKVYTLNVDAVTGNYESTTANYGALASNNPLTYGGSLVFDGWKYTAFSEDVITDGLLTAPVYVHNDTDGTVKARTIFAVESTDWVDYKFHYTYSYGVNGTAKIDWLTQDGTYDRILIDDTWYTLGVYTYEGTVEAGENTLLSLYQFFMDCCISEDVMNGEALADGYQVKFLNQVTATDFDAVTAESAAVLFKADGYDYTAKP